jgi:hypothetical protein
MNNSMEFYHFFRIQISIKKRIIIAEAKSKGNNLKSQIRQLIFLIELIHNKISSRFKDRWENKS